jgi:predicted transcriptional regulator
VVTIYHMRDASKTSRTSMSLDSDTLDAIGHLAKKWNTSKSEVIRRSIRNERQRDALDSAKCSPADAIRWLQTNGITSQQAATMREEIQRERNARKPWWK